MLIKPPRNLSRLLAVFALALVLALPLSLSFASEAQAQSAEATYQQAVKFYNAKNYKKAAPLLRKSAEQGHADAQYNLGFLYRKGEGVKQDYKQAAEWYRKAADQGNANAQSNLGFLYGEGKGVKQDYKQAAEWYRKAAEQGHAVALNNLAIMYGQGHGVKQDFPTTYALFLLSVKEGNEGARKLTDEAKKVLTTEQVMAGQKIAREWEQRIEKNKQNNKQKIIGLKPRQ